jgi:UDP:flavonoid glycosyltransferase YjiC (YdhE family)
VAELKNLKWASVLLQPFGIVSAYDPPVMPGIPELRALRRLGPRFHRLVFALIRAAIRRRARPIANFRRGIGLAQAGNHPLLEGVFSPFLTLGVFSPILAGPQPDWPAGLQITGFAWPEGFGEEQTLEPELDRFLDSGDAPVVCTLGTTAVLGAGGFYRECIEAARRLGLRAVLVTGREERPLDLPQSRDVFVTAYAPHSLLMARALASSTMAGSAQWLRH